jgi:hypothetical protein
MTFGKAFGIALAAPGLLACRQILGLDVSPAGEPGASADAGSDAGAGACGLPSGTSTCASCARENCCAESTSCAADSVFCAPYESCLAACVGDPACRSKCTIDHPVPGTSSDPVSALGACLAAKCETQCGLTCGGFAGYLSEPDTSAGCQSCLTQNACANALACGSSADCDAFWRCYLACPTLDCKDACVERHDAGVAAFAPLFKDFSGTCAQPCGFGHYWACAGRIGYPTSKSPTASWTNWVYDEGTQAGVPGANVSICSNCPCPTASFPLLAQGQTGADGFFSLQIPQVLSPNGQSQPLCVETTASGYATTFLYTGFPFSEPTSSIKDSLGPYVSLGLVLFAASNVQQDTTALGGTYDPMRGTIAAGIFDCLTNPADGVYVSIDKSDPLIVLAAPVDAGADAGLTTLSGGFNTDGHAVFFNVAPGSYTLTATPKGLSQPIDQITVNVASGTVTQVGVFPAP